MNDTNHQEHHLASPATARRSSASTTSTSTRPHRHAPSASAAPRSASEPLLTVDELCELIKVEPTTVYQLTYKGKIPCYKIANRLRFRLSEMLEWIEKHRVNKNR